MSSTSGWLAAHSFAAFSIVKKKSTGNFVIRPSFVFSPVADASALGGVDDATLGAVVGSLAGDWLAAVPLHAATDVSRPTTSRMRTVLMAFLSSRSGGSGALRVAGA